MAIPPPETPKGARISVRPARLREYRTIGSIAAETYFHTPLISYLSPGRMRYYSHYERGFQKRTLMHMLDARVRSIVACEDDVPIAYIRFKRLGDDRGAREYIRQRESVRLWILRWLAWAYYLLIWVAMGDKSQDEEAVRQFVLLAEDDENLYWEPCEGGETRIHVLSFVVLKRFQGRGVGKKLLTEVTKRAVKENVIIGLEASPDGEFIYRSAGFEMLGRFKPHPEGVFLGDGGGIFKWTPPALKASNEATR